MQPHNVLVTVTGYDRPGVTSALFAALAAHDVEVLDVEQLVLRDRLVLGVVLALHGDPGHLRRAATRAAEALGIEIEVTITEDLPDPAARQPVRHHVTVLGRPLRAGAVGEVARRIADLGGNIESISKVADEPYVGLEMVVAGAEQRALTRALVTAAQETGTDIAVQRAELRRRSKRLVLLDADRTLIPVDTLGLLAEIAGRGAESARLLASVGSPREPDDTHGPNEAAEAAEAAVEAVEAIEAADRREAELFRARCALLAGVPADVLDEARQELQAAPGTHALVGALKRSGFRCGAVSAGVAQVVEPLLDSLGRDFATANRLEVSDERLTGRVVGAGVDREGKARALVRFAEAYGVPLVQTVAVGGPGDLDLLRRAGLGLTLGAEPAAPGTGYGDTLLFVLGLRRQDSDETDRVQLAVPRAR